MLVINIIIKLCMIINIIIILYGDYITPTRGVCTGEGARFLYPTPPTHPLSPILTFLSIFVKTFFQKNRRNKCYFDKSTLPHPLFFGKVIYTLIQIF